MRALWTDEVASYHGQHVHFDSVRCDPHPVNGRIPIHIGGVSPAAIRRAATYGDGYFPWVAPGKGFDLDETLRRTIRDVRDRAETLGRDPASIEMTVGGARTVEDAERYRALGADRLVIAIRARSVSEIADELGEFADTVIAKTTDL
jgi:alkanesulfonate monooxygenase SsuD/methylene tetrahydromethanopterin reductase-like flavin-dependent oxidoreductase (luciferase family)